MHDQRIVDMVRAVSLHSPPKTQEDWCRIAAVCAVAADDKMPAIGDGQRVIDMALGLAKGLFGPAFDSADDERRWGWIDRCEFELRAAMERNADASGKNG